MKSNTKEQHMEYTPLGKTGLTASRFGLGCMRFPENKADAVGMARYAIDMGVTYIDTAYAYENSEAIVGEALRDGYRERVTLASKSPVWLVHAHSDFEKFLDEELKRLRTDYIDMYLLHNLNPGNWEAVKKYDGFSFLDAMIKKGKIRYKAFSIHNTAEAFKKIVDIFDWDMAQIQLNILGETYQAGIEGLRYGAQKGLAMVIMEPLRGGSIINNTPPAVKKLLSAYPEKRSLVEWCFRWLYNMSEASVILSGTSTIEQLKDNVRIFAASRPNVMSEKDRELIHAIQKIYKSNPGIPCTACNYCMPCPQCLDIPNLFQLYNQYLLFNRPVNDSLIYQNSRMICADKCIQCGRCTEHCPQQLAIPLLMKIVHRELM
jgi:predicted aldo/keto reductase-like oxidoreductase